MGRIVEVADLGPEVGFASLDATVRDGARLDAIVRTRIVHKETFPLVDNLRSAGDLEIACRVGHDQVTAGLAGAEREATVPLHFRGEQLIAIRRSAYRSGIIGLVDDDVVPRGICLANGDLCA